MYIVKVVGGKVIATTEKRKDAMMIANTFANTHCTFTRVYCGDKLIAIYS